MPRRLRSERYVVQSPIVRYAEEAGWTKLTRNEALARRHSEGPEVLEAATES